MSFKQILFIFTTSIILICSTDVQGQNHSCGQQHVTDQWFTKNPLLFKKYVAAQDHRHSTRPDVSEPRNEVFYTIPVVFHILHLGGAENISDEQIFDQMRILNRDYQKRNADTAIIVNAFKNNIANVGFAFELARIDPEGNCTNGIVRHYTYKTNWDANNLSDFTFSWPREKYMNIYVVKTLNINATAYTFLPETMVPSNADVIVAIHSMIGSSGTGTEGNSRVITHEVGHWFGLPHIWGISNAPGVVCGDDFVDDTPITKGFTSCSVTNTKICNPDINENVQNYMDYSPCKIMFTNGQKAYMRETISLGLVDRIKLVSEENLKSTGVVGELPCKVLADFYTESASFCEDAEVTYYSLSQYGSQNGQVTWSFPGGTPSTSTEPIVKVTYANQGDYPVSLTATSPNGSHTLTKMVKVDTKDGGLTVPYFANFEQSSLPAEIQILNQQDDVVLWSQNNEVGANGTNKCIFLNNMLDNSTIGHRDYFETPYYDLSNFSKLQLSYYYAYAKKFENQADSFKVEYTIDCGASWKSLPTNPNTNTMANNTGGIQATFFKPEANQWKKVVVPSSIFNTLNKPKNIKFRFFFKSGITTQGSNNIYIDEINLTGEISSSLDISKTEEMEAVIYPNPSGQASELAIAIQDPSKVEVHVLNLTGNTLYRINDYKFIENTAYYRLDQGYNLASGMYLVKVDLPGEKSVYKKWMVTHH